MVGSVRIKLNDGTAQTNMTEISHERCEHERVTFKCEMALKFANDFYGCELCNLSEGSALSRVVGGNASQLKKGDEGLCLFDYLDESFEGKCRVVSTENNLVAVQFWGLDVDQEFYIRSVSEEIKYKKQA